MLMGPNELQKMNLAKKVFALGGLDIRWIKNVRAYEQRAYEDKWAESYRFLERASIRTVLDIGANTGQFANMIVRACPDLQALHSFEPLEACQSELGQALSGDPRHYIHVFGIGDRDEERLFNHAEFSPCSSILSPNAVLTADHPGAGRIRKETIQLRTLDGWTAENTLDDEILVKIDVQGFEDKVISGGSATLRRARFVVLEVPFVQLYEDQPLFHDIYLQLHNLGLLFRGTLSQNIRKSDGRVLEADALFERADLAAPNQR